ncbi:MAG: hypothetical protein V4476_19545 [Pseudomonadota bacterium]
MILRPHQIYLLRITGRATIANGGGGGGSSSSQQATDTTSNLTNNVSSNDTRSVASDAAIALGGANDSVTQNSSTSNTATNSGNTSTSTAFASNSGNTTNTSTAFASNSGNTSSVANSGNKTDTNSGNSSNTSNLTLTTTTTDFGSVQAALDAMKSTAGMAVGLSGSVAGNAISALSHQSDNSLGMVKDLFNFASASSANSQGTAMQALGLANNSTAAANLASSDVASQAAKDKKMLMYGLAAAGVVLAFVALKK